MKADPRQVIAAMLAGLALAGCATVDPRGAAGPIAQAPSYRVGDRWVYRAQDGFRTPIVWEETHVVTATGPGGTTVRVTQRGPTLDVERVEQWPAPGVVQSGAIFDIETKTFEPPLVRYRFPLQSGDRFSQRVRDPAQPPGPYGGVSRTVIVGGTEKITTPAGTFDAIRMRVFMRLDDETFWRYPTECNYLVWYAPAVNATVREEKEAYYLEKGGAHDSGGRLRSQRAHLELVSFSRGG